MAEPKNPKPAELKTTELDTSKLKKPNENPSVEDTPIFEETTKYLEDADEADVTHFDEDDDPLDNVGELVEEGPL